MTRRMDSETWELRQMIRHATPKSLDVAATETELRRQVGIMIELAGREPEQLPDLAQMIDTMHAAQTLAIGLSIASGVTGRAEILRDAAGIMRRFVAYYYDPPMLVPLVPIANKEEE